jgi:ABC-2 type transport system ATP-binding protein
MIEIKNLSFGYGSHEVLKNINKKFDGGHIHGIVGLNGAGKTTFFNVVAGLQKGYSGTIEFDGHPVKKADTGYLETNNFFYSLITGNEFLRIFKKSNSNFNLDALQKYFHLPLDELIETYSTGMKKKLALLSILKEDRISYFFDEPFNGLDLETNKVLELIILALKDKGKTVFLSSHIMEPLLTVCDEIHILEDGIFNKSYPRNMFKDIENDLFGKFKATAKEVIVKAV